MRTGLCPDCVDALHAANNETRTCFACWHLAVPLSAPVLPCRHHTSGFLRLALQQGTALSPMALSPFVLWSAKTSLSPRRRDHHRQCWLTPGQMSPPALCYKGETHMTGEHTSSRDGLCSPAEVAGMHGIPGRSHPPGDPADLTLTVTLMPNLPPCPLTSLHQSTSQHRAHV